MKFITRLIVTIVILLVVFSACKISKSTQESTIGTITGRVIFVAGNQMPNRYVKSSEQGKGMLCEIHIYELTNSSEAERDGIFYKNLNTKLVDTIASNSEGIFETKLPEGKYTVLIKQDTRFYSPSYDKDNNLNPVVIVGNVETKVNLVINYNAYY